MEEQAGWYVLSAIIAIVFGSICASIAAKKGHSSGSGFVSGCLFGIWAILYWSFAKDLNQGRTGQPGPYQPPPTYNPPPAQPQYPTQQYQPPPYQPPQPPQQYLPPAQQQPPMPTMAELFGTNVVAQSQHAAPQTIIKIKCRNCGALEDPEAKFCSACGQPM